jgi:hypothetical protein
LGMRKFGLHPFCSTNLLNLINELDLSYGTPQDQY